MNTQDCTHTMPPRALSVLAWLLPFAGYVRDRSGERAGRIAEVALTWFERARERRQLCELSDHMLRDIGLTRGDVWAESSKPCWRP